MLRSTRNVARRGARAPGRRAFSAFRRPAVASRPLPGDVRVAVIGANGTAGSLVEAFSELNVVAEQPTDVDSWVAGPGRRVLVLEVLDDETSYDLVVDLRDSRWDLVMVTLTPDASQATYRRALRAGATAAAPADAPAEEVLDIVRSAMADRTILPASVARRLALDAPEVPTEFAPSMEEIGWLQSLATGSTTSSLADSVQVSAREMTRLLAELYDRMGADNRQSALIMAARWGMLE